jgi:DNA-binding FadR family transcriptional regulator
LHHYGTLNDGFLMRARNLSLAQEGPRGDANRTAGAIRSLIEQQISEGLLPPGTRLTTERELASKFGTSRAVVRSAVAALVANGRITRHVGRGSFVADPRKQAQEAGVFRDIRPGEMMEFRCQLEPALIDLIMLNATNADIEAIVSCAAQGEDAADRQAWNLVDDRFHRLLAAATHNSLIVALYDVFSAARKEAAWNRLKQQTVNLLIWKEFQAEHRAIARALQQGDRAAAVHATRHHVMHARAVMLGYTMAPVELNNGDGQV